MWPPIFPPMRPCWAPAFSSPLLFFKPLSRPETFPRDTVIFTGRVPLEELKEDRPQEYKELVESGELEKLLAPPPTRSFIRRAKIFGAIALAIGLTLVVLIILAEVFGYR